MQVGDVVKWWEYYSEGDIVSDAGLGVVIETVEKNIYKELKSYRVLKSTGHITSFLDYNLDLVEALNERR
jgi:hypothetical protein